MNAAFKHKVPVLFFALAVTSAASGETTDLLSAGANGWRAHDQSRWQFKGGELHGSTALLDGSKTDADASAFIVSEQAFDGDYMLSMELTFDAGRYVGVYLDFDEDTQSGIWMASGHALPEDAPANEVERGYIKTVDGGNWVVRATGELDIERGRRVKLGFSRLDGEYRLWNDGRLIATYKKSGYAPGPVQLRLTNSAVRIHRLELRTRDGKQRKRN